MVMETNQQFNDKLNKQLRDTQTTPSLKRIKKKIRIGKPLLESEIQFLESNKILLKN